MSKVSVITPAYNAEKYIEETIKSVIAQTEHDWEMIVVDDCSLDNTVNIVKSYTQKDSRIKLVLHDSNQGVAAARNTAIKVSAGQYIAFLDSDDLWMPQKLEKQILFMRENECVLSYTAYEKFGENREHKSVAIPSIMRSSDILKNTSIACLTVMVDHDKSGDFQMPLLSHCEDNCTWYSILQKTHTVAKGLNEVLSLYRTGKESLTSNKYKAATKQWNVYRRYYNFSLLKSAWYFGHYSINAIKKRL